MYWIIKSIIYGDKITMNVPTICKLFTEKMVHTRSGRPNFMIFYSVWPPVYYLTDEFSTIKTHSHTYIPMHAWVTSHLSGSVVL